MATPANASSTPSVSPDLPPIVGQVDRVHRPDPDWFQREYVQRCRPAVITGVVSEWPAMEKWTLEFFRTKLGALETEVNVQRAADTILLGQIGRFEKMTVAQLVDKLAGPPTEKIYYWRAYLMAKLLKQWPELYDDFTLPSVCPNHLDLRTKAVSRIRTYNPFKKALLAVGAAYINNGVRKHRDQPWRIVEQMGAVMFVGGPGTVTPLHADGMLTGAYLAQIMGRKHCLFISPDQDATVYPRPFRNQFGMSQVDYRKPDYKRFPRYREARPIECILHPGELLYTPHGWWHAVVALDTSISYSHQIVNDENLWQWIACVPQRLAAAVYYKLRGGGLDDVVGAPEWAES